MRKLGIVIAITAAATLGFAGHASAQQAELCGGLDSATQPIIDGGLPLDDTQDGLVDTCNNSFEKPGVVLDPLLCGVEKDVGEVIDPALGDVVGQVHGGLDDVEQALEDGGVPDIIDFDHPCAADTNSPDPTGAPGNGGGGGPEVQGATVQQQNAAADGSLPRTGGELFAGAGFALMSLGALVRRFLP